MAEDSQLTDNRGKGFLSSEVSRKSSELTMHSVKWMPVEKRPGREAGHATLPRSTEVTNACTVRIWQLDTSTTSHCIQLWQHGPVTAWFRSARPGNLIPVPKTSVFGGSWEYIVYRNGIASVKVIFYVLLEFTCVKNWIASNKLQSPALRWHCLWNVEKTFRAACGVFPPWPACLLTPALEGIIQSDKDRCNNSTPPSPSWDTQDNCLHVILTNYFFSGFPTKT